MRFSVHPWVISIDYFFQQKSYPFCVVSDDVTLKMRTEIFDSFLNKRQPIWNWEILEYDWVELSDRSVHFLYKNGVTAKIQWR